ncbi:MAG: hypothetical protein JW806_04150 [Sedimentisphaerales bacterium]|nr:hypothetical protein [Sedimentisphaerales bacterium]
MEKIDQIFDNHIPFDDNLSDLPTSAGLILFADSQDRPILLLACANIRRNAKNKLAEQIEPTKKADLKSITAKIYYKTYPCKFRLAIAHYQAVKQIFAKNYKDYITFVWPAYITVNLNDKIPSFSITKKPALAKGTKILGPLPGQRQAGVFLKALEDAFRLCKRNDIVSDVEAAKSCPYIQMDACCGVCAGKVSLAEYKEIVADAFSAGASPAGVIEQLAGKMQAASIGLSFEEAARLKKKIEKLSVLTKQTYRWTTDLEKLKIIHIDKAGKVKVEDTEPQSHKDTKKKGRKSKVQTYGVFVISFDKVIDLGDFLETDEIVNVIASEAKQSRLAPGPVPGGMAGSISSHSEAAPKNLIEQFSIVSYFLYRSKASGLWVKAEDFNKEELEKFSKL